MNFDNLEEKSLDQTFIDIELNFEIAKLVNRQQNIRDNL
jgi:hypothetical protein